MSETVKSVSVMDYSSFHFLRSSGHADRGGNPWRSRKNMFVVSLPINITVDLW